MVVLLLKFLPYLWPLFKELLQGQKDHPYFKDGVRAKSKAKVFMFVLIALLLALGNWAYDLHGQIATLEDKLLESPKKALEQAERLYSRDHVDLELCRADRERIQIDFKVVQSQLDSEKAKLLQCGTELEWERINKTPAPDLQLPPRPKPKTPAGDEVQKRLEELRKTEGN